MPKAIENIREVALEKLCSMLQTTLVEASKSLMGPEKEIFSQADVQAKIQNLFTVSTNLHFDKILGQHQEEEKELFYFELLTLAQKRELEEMITVEGMIASARNLCSPNFIPFNERMDSVLANLNIDEQNNPLDPNQITSSFEQSIQFLNLEALNRLSLFRDFNENLLKHLDDILSQLNALFIDKGVLPDLKAVYPELALDIAPAANLDNPELFSMMQGLLHSKSGEESDTLEADDEALQAMVPSGSGIMQPVQFNLDKASTNRKIEVLEPSHLLDILEEIQKLENQSTSSSANPDAEMSVFDPYLINESLGSLLSKAQNKNVILAVDRNSSDVLNLVTMLYGAIWQDANLPVPIKNLIGNTQLTVTKLALTDTGFFSREKHPARELINELANAGSEWLEEKNLDQLPLYKLMQNLVARVTLGYKDDIAIFESALKELRRTAFKEEREKLQLLEEKILKAENRQDCIDDIHELVSKRINERLSGRKVHRFFRESIENFFQKYLILVVIKDGPRGSSWKQAFNTLDVLIWTLEFNKEEADEKRVKTANSGILNSLRKMFKVSKIKENDIETLILSLNRAQEESLTPAMYEQTDEKPHSDEAVANESADGLEDAPQIKNSRASAKSSEEESDPYLQQVDLFNIGTWVEISGLDKEPLRCKLAAKIGALDKYIFVNREGAKVAETGRTGLAADLKHGKIKLVSDGLLFSRALESVIGNLQDSQDQQRTGTAFEPSS